MRRFMTAVLAAGLVAAGLAAAGGSATVQAGSEWNKAVPIAVKTEVRPIAKPIDDDAHPGKTLTEGYIGKRPQSKSALAISEWRIWSGASQFMSTTPGGTTGADGVAVKVSQHLPYVHTVSGGGSCTVTYPCYDGGVSLWEVAASDVVSLPGGGVSNGGNTIEVGWVKSQARCGQIINPCLFVYHWVGGVGQGWAVNFVDNPGEAVGAGTALAYTAAGAVPSIFYEYVIERTPASRPAWQSSGPGWQIRQQNVGSSRIIGYYPDTNWTSQGQTLTKIAYQSAFNETQSVGDGSTVGDNEQRMCTDGGSGVYGTSTSPSAALRVDGLSYINPPAGITPLWSGYVLGTDGTPQDPQAARTYLIGTTDYKSGGPGWNGASTGNGNIGSC